MHPWRRVGKCARTEGYMRRIAGGPRRNRGCGQCLGAGQPAKRAVAAEGRGGSGRQEGLEMALGVGRSRTRRRRLFIGHDPLMGASERPAPEAPAPIGCPMRAPSI